VTYWKQTIQDLNDHMPAGFKVDCRDYGDPPTTKGAISLVDTGSKEAYLTIPIPDRAIDPRIVSIRLERKDHDCLTWISRKRRGAGYGVSATVDLARDIQGEILDAIAEATGGDRLDGAVGYGPRTRTLILEGSDGINEALEEGYWWAAEAVRLSILQRLKTCVGRHHVEWTGDCSGIISRIHHRSIVCDVMRRTIRDGGDIARVLLVEEDGDRVHAARLIPRHPGDDSWKGFVDDAAAWLHGRTSTSTSTSTEGEDK
jgi:hypothetical protein